MNKNSYFASMNTSDGFKSYFDTVFDPSVLSSLYIIKGGSGTGKSTILDIVLCIAKHDEKKIAFRKLQPTLPNSPAALLEN